MHITDFSGFWAGGRALVLGADPYDPTTWTATVARMGTQPPDTPVYGYPMWVALAFVPLALFPLEVAGWLWTLTTFALAIVAVRALLRSYLPDLPLANGVAGLTITMSTPAYHTFVLGQWGFALVAASAGAILAFRRGLDRRGVICALAFLAKPQLFVAAAVGLLTTVRAAINWFVLVAFVLIASALVRPGWWVGWLAIVPERRFSLPATIYSLLSEAAGPAGAFVAVLLAIAGVALAARFRRGTDGARAVWLALSSAIAPYEWAYDHLLLLVPIIVAGGVIARGGSPSVASRLVLVGSAILLLISPLFYAIAISRHRETWSAVIPVVVFVLLVAGLWRDRDVAPSGDSRPLEQHPTSGLLAE